MLEGECRVLALRSGYGERLSLHFGLEERCVSNIPGRLRTLV